MPGRDFTGGVRGEHGGTSPNAPGGQGASSPWPPPPERIEAQAAACEAPDPQVVPHGLWVAAVTLAAATGGPADPTLGHYLYHALMGLAGKDLEEVGRQLLRAAAVNARTGYVLGKYADVADMVRRFAERGPPNGDDETEADRRQIERIRASRAEREARRRREKENRP